MTHIKNIIFLLISLSTFTQAQTETTKTQNKTIEVNNENGDLSISIANGIITEFIINEIPVSKDRYDNFQEIIDDFANVPVPPTPPTTNDTPDSEVDQSERLRTKITEYLMNNGDIKSYTKYNVQLNSKFLKVNGKKLSSERHNTCIQFFEEIYNKTLNEKTNIKFKRSRNSSVSSVSIRE